ncbi:MAG TPA: hypothetical protein VHX38_26595 [Pseudonocardiaceae bacterium]|jgi:hypothetical protein|nr:hypothetical protein [Pseudonocardiaceae bacterium]
MRGWLIGLALLGMVCAVVTGCGRASTTSSGTVAVAPVVVARSCPTMSTPAGHPTVLGVGTRRVGAIPVGFRTAWVLRCTQASQQVAGEGQWEVLTTARADTPADALVDALRAASQPRTSQPCSAILPIVPYFALVDTQDTAIAPAIPTDGCGFPQQAVTTALNALPFRTVSSTREWQIQSPTSVASGCSQSFKDLFNWTIAGQKTPVSTGAVWNGAPTGVRICAYGNLSAGSDPVGQLTFTHTVTGLLASRLATEVNQTGPVTSTCQVPNTQFAVLTPLGADTDQWLTVELDGCGRLSTSTGALRQVTAAIQAIVIAG